MRSKEAQRTFNVRYYAANRDREIERVRRRQAAKTAWLRELRNVPCADCGGRFEPHQMDFDHRDPKQKLFNIGSAAGHLRSDEALRAEVLKCEIVCANCHSIRSRT